MDIPGIKHRIIKHLPAYLLKYGHVDLDRLGRFRLNSHSSYIDHAAALIYPPYYDIKFEEGQYQQAPDYIAYLSKRLGLDDSLISEVMSGYTTTILQQLEQRETVNVEGLGTLLITSESIVLFESDGVFWGQAAVQDLAVSFMPVPRLKDQGDKQLTSSLNDNIDADAKHLDPLVSEDQGEFVDESIDMGWEDEIAETEEDVHEEGLVGLVQESSILRQEKSEFNPSDIPPQEVVQQDNTYVAADPVSEFTNEQVTERKQHRLIVPMMFGLLILIGIPLLMYLMNRDYQTLESSTIEVPSDRLNKDPKYISDATSITQDNGNEQINLGSRDDDPNSTSSEDSSKSTKNSDGKSSVQDEKVIQPIQKSPVVTLDQNEDKKQAISDLESSSEKKINVGECVIIVGAFGEPTNMRVMMNKLEKRGFKVYVDSTRSLSRVGAYSTCDNAELNRNLALIQSQIESSSWILK